MTTIENPSDFRRFVTLGTTTESLSLEFKADIPRRGASPEERRKGRLEFARDMAQFANTDGGCILLGVREGEHDGVMVATAIEPVRDFDAVQQAIEQSRQEFLAPSTVPIRVFSIPLAEGLIVAVNIPPYRHLVWVWDRQTHSMECLRRTNRGKEWLNPDEVERHLMDSSRSAKLALSEAVSRCETATPLISLCSGMWARFQSSPTTLEPIRQEVNLGGVSAHEFTLTFRNLVQPGLTIPYGLVREVWVTAENELGLMLDVRVVIENGRARASLEPF